MQNESDSQESAIIELMQELRKQGHEAIHILRVLESKGVFRWKMSTYFENAFGIESSHLDSIAYWRVSRSDAIINEIIETAFAEKRVGGSLDPKHIAAHLGIPLETLQAVLQQPEYVLQTKKMYWNKEGHLQEDMFIPPQLLRHLEAQFPHTQRSPWWYWSQNSYTHDK